MTDTAPDAMAVFQLVKELLSIEAQRPLPGTLELSEDKQLEIVEALRALEAELAAVRKMTCSGTEEWRDRAEAAERKLAEAERVCVYDGKCFSSDDPAGRERWKDASHVKASEPSEAIAAANPGGVCGYPDEHGRPGHKCVLPWGSRDDYQPRKRRPSAENQECGT